MKKLLLILFSFILSTGITWGQTTLHAGDIAIYGINTDNDDAFGFVALVDIASGTTINFTDNGVLADGSLRTGEGTLTWSSSTTITKGTVVTWEGGTWSVGSSTGTRPYFSGSGDQCIAYTGTASSPTYIYAVNIANSGWITSGDPTSNTSYLPTGLTNGTNAISVGTNDNGYYSGTTTGTASDLVSAISDPTNWTTNNSRIDLSNWPSSFTVSANTGPDNPSNFTASPASTSQIDLSWTKNSNSDNVMVAWSSDGTFGTPTDGTSYTAGSTITGGGMVLYNGGDATSYSHTNLIPGTKYYYKAWSVDGSTNYSSGVTKDATTYKVEPTNHVENFTATANGSTRIDLSWTENDGAVIPDGYLIKASTGTITAPVDGTDPTDDTDLTDGSGNVKVAHGTTSYSFTNCSPSTTYNFKIYPYTNSGSHIDFKTAGTVPSVSATTAAAPTAPDLMITEVMQNPSDVADGDGEWFEIYNYGTSTVDINGYVIKNADGSESHTINNGGSLNIAAGGFLVLGINADQTTNGGVPVDYQYSGILLSNSDDEIYLYMSDGTTLVDKVEWDGGPNWPDPTGASMVFTGRTTDNNNDGSKWTTSTERENNYQNTTGTDKGSPGTNGKEQNLVGTTTWTGTGNWSEGNKPGKTNWSHGSPGEHVSVVIDGDITVDNDVTNPASCENLSVNSGKSLTISSGKGITVNGNLSVDASTTPGHLTVSSDATGNGSLIVTGTVTGDVTVQRYVGHYTSGTGTGNGWHEIGCPVASMDPANTTWDPTRNTTDDLYAWSEVDNQWVNYRNTTFTFTAGQGYLVANSTDLTHEYTGTLNTSDVTVSNLSYTSTSGGDGWHLLGNPFSSAIKWDDGNWTLTNVGAVAEIWDEASASYTAINANDIIPSTNGFFVQVVSGTTGSVTIPAAARVHDAQGNYKQTAETPETLTFQITDDANSYSDKAILGFKPDATEQWDMAYDAHKIMSMVKTAPQIWTVSHDENFLINYLPEITTAYDVPLEFRAGVNTVYHLTIKGVSSFTNTDFILEDKVTGEKINLNEVTNYDFSAQDGDNTDRFVLHINGVTGISPASEQTDDLQVFSSGNTIYLHGQKVLNGKVFVFNTLGQKVYESILNGTTRQQIHMTQQAGIYIVRIENDHRVVTKKVYIQ